MYGRFGTALFGTTEFQARRPVQRSRRVAVLGDMSTHGGSIVTTNQDGTLRVAGIAAAVNGASHNCPLPGHGITLITAIILKTKQNGKLIVTEGAVCACGAIISPPDRKIYMG